MREFPATVKRDAQRLDWLLERTGFEPPSPFDSRAFRDLVGICIFRRDHVSGTFRKSPESWNSTLLSRQSASLGVCAGSHSINWLPWI
jgi:hypothetical protein